MAAQPVLCGGTWGTSQLVSVPPRVQGPKITIGSPPKNNGIAIG